MCVICASNVSWWLPSVNTQESCTFGWKEGKGTIIFRSGKRYSIDKFFVSILSLSQIRGVCAVPSNSHNFPVWKRKIEFDCIVSTLRKTKQNFTWATWVDVDDAPRPIPPPTPCVRSPRPCRVLCAVLPRNLRQLDHLGRLGMIQSNETKCHDVSENYRKKFSNTITYYLGLNNFVLYFFAVHVFFLWSVNCFTSLILLLKVRHD